MRRPTPLLGAAAALAAVVTFAAVPGQVARAVTCPAAGGSTVPTAATPAGAEVVAYGHGYGHSLGMSQYGAQGAARLGCTAAQILTTYYPGTHVTTSTTLGSTVMLSLLSDEAKGHADLTALSGVLTWTSGTTPALTQPTGQTWHVVRSPSGGADLQDSTGKVVMHAAVNVQLRGAEGSATPAPNIARVRTFGGSAGTTLVTDHQLKWDYTSVVGGANGLTVRQVIVPTGGVSGIEKYLWGLAEVPVSWPGAALQTQAVAARTYLAYGSWSASNGAYLIGTTTASQNYGGYAKEVEDARYASPPPWHTAVSATAGQIVVDSAGRPIDALYISSHGGRSEDVRYVWGSTGYPYLVSVDDSTWELASDDPASHRSWAYGFTRAQVAARLGLSTVTSITVGAPGTAARLAGVTVTGTLGGSPVTRTYDGWAMKGALGLPSPGFTFTKPVAPPPPDTVAPVAQASGGPAGTFEWSAADAAPSSGIAGYDVTVQHGATVDWSATATTATSHTVVATPGTTYQVTVVAHDRAGHASAPVSASSAVPDPGTYHPVAPARVADSRVGLGIAGPVGAKRSVAVAVTGLGGVPAGVSAVAANVTVTGPAAPGYLAVGDGSTGTSAASFATGQTVAQLAVLPVDPAGRVHLFNGATGSTHLVVDVQGYWTPDTTGGRLVPLTSPVRVADSRSAVRIPAAVAAGTAVTLPLAGVTGTGVPAGATVVAAQVTVVSPTASGYVNAGATRSGTSNVNYVTGATVGNLVLLPVDASGAVHLFNGGQTGSVQLLVDVTGYVAAPGDPVTGGTYDPLAGSRLADSRARLGLPGALPALSSAYVTVAGTAGSPVPAGVTAVVAAVTATAAQVPGYLAEGDGSSGTSALNFLAGSTVSNVMVLPVDASGRVRLYNGGSGTVQVVLDVQGYLG